MDRASSVKYGTVVIHLAVDRQGKIVDLRVLSGASDQLLQQIALQAVKASRLPAMPDSLIEELKGKRLPIDITFDFLPPPTPTRKPASR